MGQLVHTTQNVTGITAIVISTPVSPAAINTPDTYVVALTIGGDAGRIVRMAGITFSVYMQVTSWTGSPGVMVGVTKATTDTDGFANFSLTVTQPGTITFAFPGLGSQEPITVMQFV